MQRSTAPTPVLDYGLKPARDFTLAWQSIVAAVGGTVSIPTFMCICGYIDIWGFIATVPTAGLAWWGYARQTSGVGRILAVAVVVVASLALAKNIADVGWFGHNPLFR